MKQTKLPFWYTQGFNPHIYITFNTPLPIGVESYCESFDTRLNNDIPFVEIVERLNNYLPKNIRVLRVVEPFYKQNDIVSAKYIIKNIKCENKESLQQFLNDSEILALKKTKKGTKQVNLKEYIFKYEVLGCENELELNIVLACGNIKNLNPFFLMNEYNEKNNINKNSNLIVKKNIYVKDMVEFV